MATPETTINHVGLLVDNFDDAVERWRAATGYFFEPITRYYTHGWRDRRSPEPAEHEVRVTFSFAAFPSIELMSFFGGGTHARSRGEGLHHLGFLPIEDNFKKLDELRADGFEPDGEALSPEGRVMLFFVDRDPLGDVHAEFVEDGHEHPVTKDDGSPLNRLPSGEQTHLDLDFLAEHADDPAGGPLITAVGIEVADAAAAGRNWAKATHYQFNTPRERSRIVRDEATGETHEENELVVSSVQTGPRIDFIERRSGGTSRRRSFGFAIDGPLDEHVQRIKAAGIRITGTSTDGAGTLTWFATEPADLNQVALVFHQADG